MAENKDKKKNFHSVVSGYIDYVPKDYNAFVSALKSDPALADRLYSDLVKLEAQGYVNSVPAPDDIRTIFTGQTTPTTATETEVVAEEETPQQGTPARTFPTPQQLKQPVTNQPLPNVGVQPQTNQPQPTPEETQIAPIDQQAGQVQGGRPISGDVLANAPRQQFQWSGQAPTKPVVQPQTRMPQTPEQGMQQGGINPADLAVSTLGSAETSLISQIGSELKGIAETGYSLDKKIVSALEGTPFEGGYVAPYSKPEDSWIYQAGQGLQNFTEEYLYRNPEYAGGILDVIAQGTGSVGAIALTGGLNPAGGIMKLGTKAMTNPQLIAYGASQLFKAPMIRGAFAMVGQETDSARQLHRMANQMDKDAYVVERMALGEDKEDAGKAWETLRTKTEDEVAESMILPSVFAGITEAIPLERLLVRLGKPAQNIVLNAFKQGGIQGAEEATQEVIQQTIINAGIGNTYNEAQKLTTGLMESAEGGGATGFVLGAVLTALVGKRANIKQRVQAGEITPQEAIAEMEDINKADRFIQDKLQALDNIVNSVANEDVKKLTDLPESKTFFDKNEASLTNPITTMPTQVETIMDKIDNGILISPESLHEAYQWTNNAVRQTLENQTLTPAEKGATLNILNGMLTDIDRANTEGQRFVEQVEEVSVQDRVPAVREGVKPLPQGQEPKGTATPSISQAKAIREENKRKQAGTTTLPSSGQTIITPAPATTEVATEAVVETPTGTTAEAEVTTTPQAGGVGGEVENRKNKQLEIINKENPAPNNYNTWVRSVEDIKTADEVFEVAKNEGAIYPDFTEQDMEDALSKGEVVVYSSYPIKNGVFVSPSKMNAQDYAGGKGGKIYSKVVKLEDVAWIDEGQGQYAKVEQSLQTTPQAGAEAMTDRQLQDIVGVDVFKAIQRAESQLGEGVVDRNRLIDTAKKIQQKDNKPNLLPEHIFESLQYETGYPDNWQDLRNAIQKGGIDANSDAIQRQIEVGIELPTDIVEEFKKSKAYENASPELITQIEQLLTTPQTPVAVTEANPALADVESTAKALEGVIGKDVKPETNENIIELRDRLKKAESERTNFLISGNKSISVDEKMKDEISSLKKQIDKEENRLAEIRKTNLQAMIDNGQLKTAIDNNIITAENARLEAIGNGVKVPEWLQSIVDDNKSKKETSTDSILNRTTDFLGDEKADFMIPKTDESVRDKDTIDYLKGHVKRAIDNGRYEKAIAQGRMTANDAKVIIESFGLKVPVEIEKLLTPTQDAVQKQTAGQVPVQSGTTSSQEVAKGEPQAEPQSTADKGQAKATATQEEVGTTPTATEQASTTAEGEVGSDSKKEGNDKKIAELEKEKLKLTSRALKEFPGSPKQLKTRARIDEINAELKTLKSTPEKVTGKTTTTTTTAQTTPTTETTATNTPIDSVIGTEWDSREGKKKITGEITIKGKKYYTISIDGKSSNALILDSELQDEIKFDKVSFEEKQANETERAEAESKKKEEADKYNDIKGFGDNLSPMQKAKVVSVLNVLESYNGVVKKRKNAIEDFVKEGWFVSTLKSGKKVLMSKDGSFLELSKTQIDYAEYLIENDVLNQTPTPTTTTTEVTLNTPNETTIKDIEKIENATEKGRELALSKPVNKWVKRAFDSFQDLSSRAKKAGIYDGTTLKIGGKEYTVDTPAKFKAFLAQSQANFDAINEAVKDIPSEQKTDTNPSPKTVEEKSKEVFNDAKSTFVFPIGLNPKFKFDSRLPENVVRFFKKYFRPRGLWTKGMFSEKRRMENQISAQVQKSEFLVRDLRNAVKEAYPKGVTQEQLQAMNDVLQGMPREIPANLYAPLTKMREHIDELSQMMISEGIIDEKLVPVFDANMGIYTTRTYAIHNDPKSWLNYIENEPEGQQIRNNAVNFLRQATEAKADRLDKFADENEKRAEKLFRRSELAEGDEALMLQAKADEVIARADKQRQLAEALRSKDFDAYVKAYLEAEGQPLDVVRKGNVGAKDLGILKKRKNIPDAIRALMGEEKDPLTNYTMSVAKMSALIANNQFLNEVKVQGVADGLFTNEPKGKNIEMIASASTDSMSPLNGLYTTKDIAEAFKEFDANTKSPWYIDAMLWFNAAVKVNKTVLSQGTHIRNFISNPIIELANGYIPTLKGKAIDSQMEQILNRRFGDKEKLRDYIIKLTELGVLGQGGNYRDILSVYEDLKGNKYDYQKLIEPKITGAAKKSWNIAQKVYKGGDEFWKVVAFENERAVLEKAYGNTKTSKELDQMAADIIRKTRVDYSMVPKAVKAINKIPFTGTFVTFPAEVLRIGFNIPTVAYEEMNSGNKVLREHGIKRMAGYLTAMTLPYGVKELAKYLLGMDDEEEEARKKFLAPWAQNSTLIWIGKDRYIDTGFSDAFSILKKPIVAFSRGKSAAEGALNATKEFLGPVISEEIGYKTLKNVSDNTDEFGNPIYDENADAGTIYTQVSTYVLKQVEPGTVSQARRLYLGETGALSEKGQQYRTGDEVLNAVFGIKPVTINWDNAVSYKFRDAVEGINNSNKFFLKKSKELRKDDKEGRRKAAESTNLAVENAYNDLREYYTSALKIGMIPQKVDDIMKQSGVPKELAYAVKNNTGYKNYIIVLNDGTVIDRNTQRLLRGR